MIKCHFRFTQKELALYLNYDDFDSLQNYDYFIINKLIY